MRLLLLFYFVAVHVFIVWLIFKPGAIESLHWRLGIAEPEQSRYYQAVATHLARLDRNMAASSETPGILIIGDSHVQGMDVRAVHPRAVNMGIGGDTTAGVLARVAAYRAIEAAEAVILWIGINDFAFRDSAEIDANIGNILQVLPETVPVLLLALTPVDDRLRTGFDNKAIQLLNDKLRQRCTQPCIFVDTQLQLRASDGQLQAKYHDGDGLHLSPAGYGIVTAALRQSLESIGLIR